MSNLQVWNTRGGVYQRSPIMLNLVKGNWLGWWYLIRTNLPIIGVKTPFSVPIHLVLFSLVRKMSVWRILFKLLCQCCWQKKKKNPRICVLVQCCREKKASKNEKICQNGSCRFMSWLNKSLMLEEQFWKLIFSH